MAESSPKIDQRSPTQLLARIRELTPFYTPEWNNFVERTTGVALMQIYLNMFEQISSRLNRVPEKNFIAFLDMMGIKMRPAQSARAPVTFSLAEGTLENVLVRKGTQLTAESADGDELIFETEKDLLVSPALLQQVFSVDATLDKIYQHTTEYTGNTPFEIFTGVNKQEHSFYLGHDDLLNQEEPAVTKVFFTISKGASTGSDLNILWEYWNGNQWVNIVKFTGQDDDDTTNRLQRSGTMTLRKEHTAEIKAKEIFGIEKRWLRCRLDNRLSAAAPVELPEINTIRLSVETKNAFKPDLAFNNDIPIDLEQPEFKPFGEVPVQFDTFYIASNEVFSKKGATITLAINSKWNAPDTTLCDPPEPDPKPVLSWEYWNGVGWHGLKVIDNTNEFHDSENIIFTCPEDIKTTEVNGEEKFWIRVRIIDGDYGKEVVVKNIIVASVFPSTQVKKGCVQFPIISSLLLKYEDIKQFPESCLTFNNFNYEDRTAECKDDGKNFRPFALLPESRRSLFLGFDKPLDSGPLRILFDLDEQILGEDERVKMQWFFWNGSAWAQIAMTDGTENLTKIGMLEWVGSKDFQKAELFDKNLFWLKGSVVEGAHPKFPKIKNLLPNTVHTVQASVVADEILGGSDATANQEFSLLNPLVISQEVWVREPSEPDEEEKEIIIAREGESAIEINRDEQGEIEEVWVRWHEVDDFDLSGPKDRHYTVNKRLGEIRFGDGIEGMVPPVGEDNIMADYKYGGGKQGNVVTGAISGLKNSIPFVGAVVNHLAADGGSETESLEEVKARGPQTLKHRERAVTVEDFEWTARNTSRKVARAKCLPNTDRAGDFNPGWVTVIIIPDSNDANPRPTRQLVKVVTDGLAKHSAAIVSAPNQIYVREPDYVEVVVDVTVIPASLDTAARVENQVMAFLNKFIHPLTGGKAENGWPFGKTICRTDIFARIEAIEGVDFVERVILYKDSARQPGDLELDFFTLPFSGEHRIDLKLAGFANSGFKSTLQPECAEEDEFELCDEGANEMAV